MATIISYAKTKGYRTKCKKCKCTFEFYYWEIKKSECIA